MNDLFQTSLYFFSSLLQADAALLAFGIILVIYKLQSLDTVRQSILQSYYTRGQDYTRHMNTLVLSKDPKEIASTLIGMFGSTHEYQNYLYVVLIPAKAIEIKRSAKYPIIVIASHSILCATLLFLTQYLFDNHWIHVALLWVTLIAFGWLVFLTSRFAISLLTGIDQYEISDLLPTVHKIMQELIDAQQNRNP